MSKDNEEIADDGSDTEDADEQEEDTDESDEDDESGDDEEDAEDSDDDESDDDDDAKLPKTKKELDAAIKAAVKSALNRKGAAERTSKNRLPKNRPGKTDPRVDAHEAALTEIRQNEAKRQFGYENDLAPDEVDVVFRLTKKPTAKSLRDPIIRGALEGYRTHKRAKNNIPRGTGGRGPVPGGADYDKLPDSEKSKHFVERRKAILESKGGSRRR